MTSQRPPGTPPSVSGRSTQVKAEVADQLISDENSGGGGGNVTADALSRGCQRLSGASGRQRVMSLTPTWEEEKEATPEYSFLWQSGAGIAANHMLMHSTRGSRMPVQ